MLLIRSTALPAGRVASSAAFIAVQRDTGFTSQTVAGLHNLVAASRTGAPPG